MTDVLDELRGLIDTEHEWDARNAVDHAINERVDTILGHLDEFRAAHPGLVDMTGWTDTMLAACAHLIAELKQQNDYYAVQFEFDPRNDTRLVDAVNRVLEQQATIERLRKDRHA
ncbi:MAG TPA: hypothetical protein DCQ64_02500 [Candidatus Rokubacteria bacterium]|nr:hypothetical protein [Candidatus Rokubacteria bacterium]